MTLSAVPVPHPCSTLEQRWSACRARVYVAADWEAQWGDTPRLDMFSCTIWREFAVAYHDRPCTSPRRHQCRNGAAGWVHRWVIDWERCEELPW